MRRSLFAALILLFGILSPVGAASAGRLVHPFGDAGTSTFNAAGELIGRSDGTEVQSFGYDAAGRRVEMVDSSGSTSYSFVVNGRRPAASFSASRASSIRGSSAGFEQIIANSYGAGEARRILLRRYGPRVAVGLGGVFLTASEVLIGADSDSDELDQDPLRRSPNSDEALALSFSESVETVRWCRESEGPDSEACRGLSADLVWALWGDDAPNTAQPGAFKRTESLSGRPSSRQVTEMAEEMSTTGWNGPPIKVVDVGGDLYVVDGHHRLAAARLAGIDVPYEVVDPPTVIGPGQWSSVQDILDDSFGVGPDRVRGTR